MESYSQVNQDYRKYRKYKQKYLRLQRLLGGAERNPPTVSEDAQQHLKKKYPSFYFDGDIVYLSGKYLFNKDDTTALVELLNKTPTITKLDLDNTPMKGDKMKKLVKGLVHLEELQLDKSSLNDEDIKILADALNNNRTLKILILSNNDTLTAQGIKDVARIVSESNVQTLYLSGVTIDSDGAESLKGALETNQSLLELYINRCNIDAKGAEILAEALQQNQKLETLNLGNNNIGDDGLKALASALQKNPQTVLRTLFLDHNNITDDGAVALSDSLGTEEGKNNTLEYIKTLSFGNTITQDIITQINDKLQANRDNAVPSPEQAENVHED